MHPLDYYKEKMFVNNLFSQLICYLSTTVIYIHSYNLSIVDLLVNTWLLISAIIN